MSLENIISKIINDAEAKAAEFKKEALNSAETIIKDANKKAKSLSLDIINEAKKKMALENKRFEIDQAIEFKKEILDIKQKLIDELFGRVKEKLINLKDEEYSSLVETLLLNFVESGQETFVISKRDEDRLSKEFINAVNKELIKLGKAGELKLKVDDRLEGHTFILETPRTRINISFDSLLANLREDLVGEVAQMLFRQNDCRTG